MMTSLWELQQSYLVNCQVGLNNQINLELSTAYMYRSVASYFDGSNVTLSEFTQFFQGQSTQQMWLHNQHGGLTQQPDPNNPVGNNSYSTPMAEPCALCLAMSINQTLLNLQQPAVENNDVRLSSVLQEQLASTQQAGDHPTSLHRQEQPEATGAENLHDKFSQGDKKN
ncbi:ferritin heavy chain-like [Glossophaga mutica]